jgi:hypothetical protein
VRVKGFASTSSTSTVCCGRSVQGACHKSRAGMGPLDRDAGRHAVAGRLEQLLDAASCERGGGQQHAACPGGDGCHTRNRWRTFAVTREMLSSTGSEQG